ncbi:hypothetical protein AVA65_08260 [Salmonella enterica subsp. enterica serovar Minnesota]|nr:hypothetical protein [Salmonella enterica subsp. enterica serovar Minnesota]
MEQQPGFDPDLNKDLLNEEVASAPRPTIGQSATAPVQQPAPVVQPETVQPVPQPVAEQNVPEARIDQDHTAQNTPFKNFVPMSSLFIKKLTEKEKEDGYLTIFLGNHRDVIEAKNELIKNWMVFRASIGMLEAGEITEQEMESAKANWEEYLAANHPGEDQEEMEKYCMELYQFIDTLQDGIKVRSRVMQEESISNMSDRGSKTFSPDVVGKQPKAQLKTIALHEQMRRAALNANQDLYEFDILLRNSFMGLSIRRPNLLSLGSLIQAISNQVKGYVRQINNPSISLAYIAGIRCMWDYLSKLIVSCTVKDTSDFRDLADSILLTDIDQLAVGLLNSIYTRGVHLELRCMNPKCNWSDFGLADPAKLLDVRKKFEKPEEAAAYANIINRRRKYSREEMEAFQSKTNYGIEDTRVYGKNGHHYFRIAPPTLTQAFETLEFFTETINPRIQELRANTLDPKQFEDELTALLTSVSSAEYLHWISEYVVVPEPGSDAEPIVYKRPKHDTQEFNRGLMAILEDDAVLGSELVKFVYNKSPFMTRVFTGVDHHECPKCKENSAAHDGRKLGFTPINAFMSFFTLTQLKLMVRTVQADQTNREALSD